MKKSTIIYIVAIVISVLVIGLAIGFAIASKKNKNNDSAKNIKIIKYAQNQQNTEKSVIEKEIELKKKKDINRLSEICNNISLEQDETTKGLGIKTDVEIDLQNGITLSLQNGLDDYCSYSSSGVNVTIKMPEGLVDFVNDVLKD